MQLSGLARAVYRVLGLAHLFVNRCPQCHCRQNSNKLTTGLSGADVRLSCHKVILTDSKNPITAVNNVMSPGSAGTHVCMHACTHTLIHVYINKMIHNYNV